MLFARVYEGTPVATQVGEVGKNMKFVALYIFFEIVNAKELFCQLCDCDNE